MDRAKVRGVSTGRKNRKRRTKEQRTGAARRSFATVAKIVGAVAFVGGLGVGSHQLHRFATTSDRFAVEDVVVTGYERATPDAVAKLSGAQPGENIFSLDVDRMKRTIEAHPWVESARVSKSYPRTIQIEVVEHIPRVLVALGHLYYANENGDVVKRYSPGEQEALPVVTGLTRDQIETDDGEARAQLRSAIDFLEALETRYGEDAPHVAEVHLDPALGLSFRWAGRDLTVVVGHPPFTRAIERLGQIEAALATRKVDAEQIVLGFDRRSDRAVARLAKKRGR